MARTTARAVIPDKGRPTWRCLLLGHRAGFRSPHDPHRWLALACTRCGDYPVNLDGRYRGPGHTRAAAALRARLGIPERAGAVRAPAPAGAGRPRT